MVQNLLERIKITSRLQGVAASVTLRTQIYPNLCVVSFRVFVVGPTLFSFEITSRVDSLPFRLHTFLSFVDEDLPRKLLN
jgi:hypothetical protein